MPAVKNFICLELDEKSCFRSGTKYVHEGKYMAEVEVELIVRKNEWSPYLTLEDAYKLDDVREPLRRGDVKTAAENAKIYTLQPVTIRSGIAQPNASADLQRSATPCKPLSLSKNRHHENR